MKKLFLMLLAIGTFTSCSSLSKTITVTNSADFARKSEMVEVRLSDLQINPAKTTFILKNQDKEVAYQIVNKQNANEALLIFQATVNAGEKSVFEISKGKPAAVKPLTFARQVPERKDDFAWENDLAGYRMYGPALANENPSNGVDLWLKRTSELVVDKRYQDELVNGKSYHIDHGDGLDCYKVGHTLGAGGISPYVNEKLWVGNFYNSYRVIENGPLRSVFELKYNAVNIDGETYSQTLTITSDAGSLLNKAIVKFEGADKEMKLAGGIFIHDGKGSIKDSADKGFIAYAENAVSDAGVPSGRNYVGILIPKGATESQKDKEHVLIMTDYKPGTEFTYYFGGGWSKWGFPTDADWFKAMQTFSNKLQSPLKVEIK
ncbi:MAG: DUF4861 domain-containing protein [Paludibacter sp.]|nr:DUF4861 domain-containing protein [Paludibacter sp.]